VSPETKKKLLYGGGALASIAALVLFLRKNQQTAMPISGAGTGLSGAGGASSGTSANNAAALNAATALAVEQSRQQSALDVAKLQATTALSIAGLQAGTAQQAASQRTAQAALGPGGAVTAAPAAAKGLFDTLQELISKAFAGSDTPSYGASGPNAIPEGINPQSGQTVYGGQLYPFAGPPEIYGPVPDATPYVSPATYEENGVPFAGELIAAGDSYYQGSTGSGDSSWYGENGGTGSGGSGVAVYEFDPGSGETYTTID
jgi:hypothetical protein